jgi:hypothetical protein
MIEMSWRNRYIVPLLILIVSGLINAGHAQSRYDSAYAVMAKQRPEKLIVFTDRSLYAVNETIHFSALLQSGADPYPDPGSEVLYAELVNSSGEAVAKGKYPISENWSAGHISIPSTIFSGTYYLRLYTRWMRNFGAGSFTYLPLRVVNPFSNDAIIANPETGKPDLIPVSKGPGYVLISPARHSYGPGALVDVELTLKEGSNIHVQHACISVVPEGAIDTSAFIHQLDLNPDTPASFQFNFLPDRNGTAISGTVLEKNSRTPAPAIPVHFSILGENPAYFATVSDQRGRFLTNIPPRLDNQEMFVIPEPQADQSLEVRIENDFSPDLLPFHPESFSLQQDEKRLASRLSLHMQLQMAFMAEAEIDSAMTSKPSKNTPFYGLPGISVKIDEFIKLPNMEEVIENLVPRTYVRRRRGSPYFMIDSENPMISMFHPLILIDHIPVFDMEVVLAIPPSKIDYIEVIPEVYVRGGMKYGGIISITSRQGDLAGIKLSEGSYFFDYATLRPPPVPQGPRYKGPGTIPDTRNTLFWNDHMALDQDTTSRISFLAASVPGTYLILFRGVSSDGTIVHGQNHIIVD